MVVEIQENHWVDLSRADSIQVEHQKAYAESGTHYPPCVKVFLYYVNMPFVFTFPEDYDPQELVDQFKAAHRN